MSENNLPAPGNYEAQRCREMVVGEVQSGAVMLYIPYRFVNSEIAHEDVHSMCLVAKDGTVQGKNIETLHQVFPAWESTNPFDLESVPLPEDGVVEFLLKECFHEPYPAKGGKTRVSFKVKWFNAPGRDPRIPEKMDDASRKTLLAKFNSKFKAIGGFKKPESTNPAVPKTPVAPVPKAPAKPTRTSTAEEVYDIVKKKNDGKTEDELAGIFYQVQWDIFPNKEKDENSQFVEPLTAEEWGKVADKLES